MQNSNGLINSSSVGYQGNFHLIGALLGYVSMLVPGVQLRKLIKIIYLIDEAFVERRGFPLTWLDYYAWEKGPVARELYSLKDGAFSDYVICRKNGDGKNIVSSQQGDSLSLQQFSEYELQVIDEMVARYAGMSSDELTGKTHEQGTLWHRTVADRNIDFSVSKESDALVDLRAIAEAYGNEDIYDDARWNMELLAVMNR